VREIAQSRTRSSRSVAIPSRSTASHFSRHGPLRQTKNSIGCSKYRCFARTAASAYSSAVGVFPFFSIHARRFASVSVGTARRTGS
jgi:hypothetical protein